MAEEKKNITYAYIGNALRSAAADGVTAFADELFDIERQEYQQDINSMVAKETENPEFIYYFTDADDRLLWWINTDGSIDWGKGVPKPIQEELRKLEALIKGNFGNIEQLEQLINANKADISTINEALANKVDGTYEENPEFIRVYKDEDGRIISCIKNDGSSYIRNVESETIPTEFSNCEDEEERIEVKKDADGRILSELTKNGKTIFHSGISSPEIDDIYNKLESIHLSNNVKSIVESEPVKYGTESKGAFSTLTNTSYYVTVENIVTGTRGWLTSIGIYCSAGNKTFAIGYIDQRNWAIVRKEFTVNIPLSGYNEIDISNEHIIIEKDEKLFVVANGIGYLPLTEESSQPQMIYGAKTGVLERYDGYGATLYFNWTVTDVDALYPFIEDFENMSKSVNNVQEKANELYNNNNIIYDNVGNPYKIKVIDGNIVPVLQRFKNVVVLGNSVTLHGYSTLESTMWLSSDKGMAATIIDNDFCHLLQEGLRTYFNDAIIHPYGIVTWERTLDTNEDNINAFLPDIENVDMVITAISENMTSNDVNEIQNAFEVLLKCIANKYQNAEIVVTSTRLLRGSDLSSVSNRDIAMSNAASKFKYKYIDVRQNKFDAFCTNFNTGDWIPMFINGDSDIFPAQKAVYSHTSDIGMLRIANIILKDIGYNQLTDKIYNISVSANQDVYCPAYWVEKGLVTCLCYNSIPSSVTAISDDGNIETRIVDFSTITLYATPSKMPKAAVVFTMPKNNVSLTIN